MKIVIFGAAGGADRVLVEQTLDQGHSVTGFDRHTGSDFVLSSSDDHAGRHVRLCCGRGGHQREGGGILRARRKTRRDHTGLFGWNQEYLPGDASDPSLAAYVLSFLGAALLMLTGYLGGELTMHLRVAIKPGANLNASSPLARAPRM